MQQNGGVFGRNPTFNNLEVSGYLQVRGSTYSYATDSVVNYGRLATYYDSGLESFVVEPQKGGSFVPNAGLTFKSLSGSVSFSATSIAMDAGRQLRFGTNLFISAPAAGIALLSTNVIATGAVAVELNEFASPPAAPTANKVRLYIEDNGAGKTRLMAIFSSGAAQQLAIEP